MAKTETIKDDEKILAAQRAVRRKNKKIKRLYIGLAIAFLVIAIGSIFAGIQYKKLKDENARLSNPQESAKVESDRLKKQVAALIDVPTDEEPTIATVSDANKAKEQSPTFFANAKNDDRLLLYAKAKKAILYRPSTNKIIEISTVNVGGNQQNQQGAAQSAVQAPAATTPSSTEQPGLTPTP